MAGVRGGGKEDTVGGRVVTGWVHGVRACAVERGLSREVNWISIDGLRDGYHTGKRTSRD